MRKTCWMLTVLLPLCACEKAVTIDHHLSVEFPRQEVLQPVTVLLSEEGSADIRITETGVLSSLEGLAETALPTGQTLLRYKSLALVTGSCPDAEALLEHTFWTEPGLQWMYILDEGGEAFHTCGFVDCLHSNGIEAEGRVLLAGSNVYDKISALTAPPVRFTVQVREVQP